jgi:hypothetical protein
MRFPKATSDFRSNALYLTLVAEQPQSINPQGEADAARVLARAKPCWSEKVREEFYMLARRNARVACCFS